MSWLQLSFCLGLNCLALSCFGLNCFALSFFALSCFALRFLVLSCLVLSCLAFPCLVLSCLALSYLVSFSSSRPDSSCLFLPNDLALSSDCYFFCSLFRVLIATDPPIIFSETAVKRRKLDDVTSHVTTTTPADKAKDRPWLTELSYPMFPAKKRKKSKAARKFKEMMMMMLQESKIRRVKLKAPLFVIPIQNVSNLLCRHLVQKRLSSKLLHYALRIVACPDRKVPWM